MRLINLTPHEVTVYSDGAPYAVFPPSGDVARVTEYHDGAEVLPVRLGVLPGDEDAGYVGLFWELPVTRLRLGERQVTGLPDDDERAAYLVSRLVAEALAGRHDLYCPGPEIRDDSGRIIGCDGLYSVGR